jgi:hypothetical protein
VAHLKENSDKEGSLKSERFLNEADYGITKQVIK